MIRSLWDGLPGRSGGFSLLPLHQFLLLQKDNLLENVGVNVLALENLAQLLFSQVLDIKLTEVLLNNFLFLLACTLWPLFLGGLRDRFLGHFLLLLLFRLRLLVLLQLLQEHEDNLLNLVLGHGLEVYDDGVSLVVNDFFPLEFFHLLLELLLYVFWDIVQVYFAHFFFFFMALFLFLLLLVFLLDHV